MKKLFWCISDWKPCIVQHEFYHALGFWHEQQRADYASNIDVHTGTTYTAFYVANYVSAFTGHFFFDSWD